jgi:VanZ family protein
VTLAESATVAAALTLGLCLAWRARPGTRLALCATTLVVSAAMFTPSRILASFVGSHWLAFAEGASAKLHLSFSDLAHLVAFFWLALVLWLFRPDWRGWRSLTVLVALAIGGELMQGLSEDRSPKLVDVGINLVGLFAGVLLAKSWIAFRARKALPPFQAS